MSLADWHLRDELPDPYALLPFNRWAFAFYVNEVEKLGYVPDDLACWFEDYYDWITR